MGGSGKEKMKILFLCTGNACRSQMAEGWARQLKADRFEVFSAGISPCYVHPLAIEVMAEEGVDISGHYSKHVEDLAGIRFDYMVTLCGYADEICPDFKGFGKRVHYPFEDPVMARGSKPEVMAKFRSTRDKIRALVEGMPENLEDAEEAPS
jgi:arsenate reductase (thioredoxin)